VVLDDITTSPSDQSPKYTASNIGVPDSHTLNISPGIHVTRDSLPDHHVTATPLPDEYVILVSVPLLEPIISFEFHSNVYADTSHVDSAILCVLKDYTAKVYTC